MKCVECQESIEPGARLCKECKSHQSVWRNELKYWAGVAGVLTLIASGLVFTTDLGTRLWQKLFGRELVVTNIDPFGKTVIWNLSNGTLHLRTIRIRSSAPDNDLGWDIYESIKAGDYQPLNLMKISQETWHGTWQEIFGKEPGDYAPLPPHVFKEVATSNVRDKFVPTFLMPESDAYAQLTQRLGKKFSSFECTITLNYTRLSDGSTAASAVPCRGAFRVRVP